MMQAWLDAAVGGVLGLLVGSFLNVVIHRLPRMMYRDWLRDAAGNLAPIPDVPSLWRLVMGPSAPAPQGLETAAAEALAAVDRLEPLTLSRPASRCGQCGTPIRWYQNVPLLSFALLRGRCGSCSQGIGWRYPAVELAAGLLFALCAWRWGLTPPAALWAAFCALLVCQFMIDLDTQLLPDSLNYLLLWLGLLGSALGWTGVPVSSALWGAALGYLSLWSIFHLYRLATGKEGMGYGDFKLLAALGAWFGADFLVAIVLASSLVGAILGGALLLAGRLAHKDIPISFGPFLAGAGLLCLVVGPDTLRASVPFAFPLVALGH
nr:A24 family peptidase [Xenophilus sp. Marseille-Q4582]